MKKTFITALLLLVVSAQGVSSHGTGGEFVQDKNGYKIDVGYDPKDLYANEPSNFDFKLLKDGQNVEYTDIWVRIVQDTQTILATGVHNQNFGGTTLLYEFPTEGNFTIHVRYQNNGESVVETEFPVTVLASEAADNSNRNLMFIFGFMIALVLGLALGIVIGRTTKLLR